MLAATATSIVRPVGVLLGGNGRRRQGLATPARPCALLRPSLCKTRHVPRRRSGAVCLEGCRHD